MLDGIQLRWKLWNFQREKDKLMRAYAKDFEEARRTKASVDELQKMTHSEILGVAMIDDAIYHAHTRYLVAEANQLILPVPDRKDETRWTESRLTGMQYLTPFGLSELRSAIRVERKLKVERALVWLPIVGAVTGLVGATTGLIAILSRTAGH